MANQTSKSTVIGVGNLVGGYAAIYLQKKSEWHLFLGENSFKEQAFVSNQKQ